MPALASLAATLAMSQGARNWPFLTLTARPVLAAAIRRSVCRHRKAGICRTSTASATLGALAGLVDVRQYRDTAGLADLGQDRQGLLEADAAWAVDAGTVGLVERGFVDQTDAELGRELLERRRHLEGMGPELEGAGPGDEHQRQVVADRHVADLDVARRSRLAGFRHGIPIRLSADAARGRRVHPARYIDRLAPPLSRVLIYAQTEDRGAGTSVQRGRMQLVQG